MGRRVSNHGREGDPVLSKVSRIGRAALRAAPVAIPFVLAPVGEAAANGQEHARISYEALIEALGYDDPGTPDLLSPG